MRSAARPASLLLALAALGSGLATAQKLNPAHWEITAERPVVRPGTKLLIKAAVRLDAGWHMYSLTTPKGGGLPLVLSVVPSPPITKTRLFQPKPVRKMDPAFGVETETYEGEPVFYIAAEVAADAPTGPVELTTNVKYSVCRDTVCLPPRKVAAPVPITIDPKAPAEASQVPVDYIEATIANPATLPGSPVGIPSARPVSPASPDGLPTFLLVAFGAGLAAIFTPCVFPMIPITLSFFLNREGVTRAESLKQAAVFCLGIVVLFTGIGVALAAAVGPFAVVQLAANPWVNAFIAAIFLAFGLSLLGAFEITMPSALVNRMNRASERGGIAGSLLMGLTFSLTSFACVGPFVGTLLAASVQQGGVQPVLGMAVFAAGLAAPFFLLALFPAYLKKLPRSGGWLVRVKVVLGFVILAAMLKYLSSIDQVLQWNILTRERFLAFWVVLFALPGLYLLGFLRLEGIDRDAPMGVARTLIGAAFLVFAVSLLPGMFGRSLGELDAYVPLAVSGAGPVGASGEPQGGTTWLKNQYREALTTAREQNKLVFVSFTGYACTNCHWMKANMFPRPEIAAAFKNFVTVELYTDGTDAASEENQKLQEIRFSTVAIPFYAIMTPDERVVASWAGLQRDPAQFLAFLNSK
jgi:thiol:disulfide interchange protein